MTTLTELRKISLEFRRHSSSFLSATYKDASVMIQRFKAFIDGTEFISNTIEKTIKEIEFDYRDCFKEHAYGSSHDIIIPVDTRCHVKAMYDYLSKIVEDGSNVYGVAMSFHHYEKKFDDIVRGFIDRAFKPLIDFINDSISAEMIRLESEKVPNLVQNIGTLYGTANLQGSGTINSETDNHLERISQIAELLGKVIQSIDIEGDAGIPEDALEDVKDDLNSIEEQIKSSSPKKSRLKKAVSGIQKFVEEFSMKLAVSLATTGVVQTDWEALIVEINELINRL